MSNYADIKSLISRSVTYAPLTASGAKPSETIMFRAEGNDPSLNDLVLAPNFKIPKPKTLIDEARKRGNDPWQARVIGNEALIAVGKLTVFLDSAFRMRLHEEIRRASGEVLTTNEILSRHSSLNYKDHNGSFTLRAQHSSIGNLDFVRTEKDGRKVYEIRRANSDGKGFNDLLRCEKYEQVSDGRGGWDTGSKVLTINYDNPTPVAGHNRFKFELGIKNGEWAGKISNKKLNQQAQEEPIDDSAFDFEINEAKELADALNLRHNYFKARA